MPFLHLDRSDPEKISIFSLVDKSDYALCYIHIFATDGAKGYCDAIYNDGARSRLVEIRWHATSIIDSKLIYQGLCVVQNVINEPATVHTKPDSLYVSNTVA